MCFRFLYLQSGNPKFESTTTSHFTMWKGRFQTETSNLVQRYGESISYDWRLYAHDIAGSIAHAAALQAAGIITKTEQRAWATTYAE